MRERRDLLTMVRRAILRAAFLADLVLAMVDRVPRRRRCRHHVEVFRNTAGGERPEAALLIITAARCVNARGFSALRPPCGRARNRSRRPRARGRPPRTWSAAARPAPKPDRREYARAMP